MKEELIINIFPKLLSFRLTPTSARDTELISAARESEKEADIRFLAP